MTYWETIHTEPREGFEIVVSIAPEDEDPRDHFDDDGETAQAIADGEYEWFMARVEARAAGVTLGTAYLGGCCYERASDFVRAPSDYYADMIAEALDEARRTARAIAQEVTT
jgi:hypothetical protein